MRKPIVLSAAALLLTSVAFLPTKALAHDSLHRAVDNQRKQADHARHDAGISWQADRQIHAQEGAEHRLQHQMTRSSGYRGYQNNYPYTPTVNGYQGTGLGGGLGNWFGTSNAYYPNSQYSNLGGYGNSYPLNGNAYGSINAGAYVDPTGHTHTADGHRFDHHGNHDDGPGDF